VVGTSGIAVWAEGIKADLKQRLPGQRKTQRDKLSLLVTTMLHVRSDNLVELASGLSRPGHRWDMGYQWIARFLANDLVSCDNERLAPTSPACSVQPPLSGPCKMLVQHGSRGLL